MAIQRSGGVVFGAPERSRQRLTTSPDGRTCEDESCQTVLSVYNPQTRCSLHEPPKLKGLPAKP